LVVLISTPSTSKKTVSKTWGTTKFGLIQTVDVVIYQNIPFSPFCLDSYYDITSLRFLSKGQNKESVKSCDGLLWKGRLGSEWKKCRGRDAAFHHLSFLASFCCL